MENANNHEMKLKMAFIIIMKTDLPWFIVTIHSGLCEQYVKIWLPVSRALVHCDNKPPFIITTIFITIIIIFSIVLIFKFCAQDFFVKMGALYTARYGNTANLYL